jgi:hypothetical protein
MLCCQQSDLINSQTQQCITLPLLLLLTVPAGNMQYIPVEPHSRIFSAGASWQLPAFVVCLASSYLQRLIAQDALLATAAGACSGFEAYHHSLPKKVRPLNCYC